MRLNLSIILTGIFLFSWFVSRLIPTHVWNDFLILHTVLLQAVAYYFKYFSLVIICVAVYELFKQKKVTQAVVSLSLGIIIYGVIYWLTTPVYKYNPDLVYDDIGKISFETNGKKGASTFSCKFDFMLKVEVEKKSETLINEIRANSDYILETVKKATQDSCTANNIEVLVNQKCLNDINSKLKTGKIKQLIFNDLNKSTSQTWPGAE